MKKTIWRICSKVFGPVAKLLNWCGRGQKRGIMKTNIGSLIIGTSKMSYKYIYIYSAMHK